MNILPKKRWHVRTRENIARVRKDELEAREEAEEKRKRVLQAEQEARTTLLRERARAKYGVPEQPLQEDEPPSEVKSCNDKHVNFFEELEEGKVVTTKTNAETELEEKEKREKYEKQIGYLTYLGQDTVETTGNVPWYDKVPEHHQFNVASQEEKNIKSKLLNDPLTVIKKYMTSETKSSNKSSEMPSSSKKHSVLDYQSIHKRKRKKKQKKKSKKRRKRSSKSSSSGSESSSDSESDNEVKVQGRKSLEQLRAERLKREKEERERTQRLLARLQGKEVKEEKKEVPVVQQKYNSQYNPELAKQNFAMYSKN